MQLPGYHKIKYINFIVLTLTGHCLESVLIIVSQLLPVSILLGQQMHCSQILSQSVHAKVTILALMALDTNDTRFALALTRVGIAVVQHSRAQWIAIAGLALQFHVGKAHIASIALLASKSRLAQTLAIGAVAECTLRAVGIAVAGFTADGGITPVAELATFAVPTLGVAQASDASACGHIARSTIALAAPAAAAQLQRIAIVAIVTYLTMIASVTFRALRANVFRMLDQTGLGTQIHVVVALQLAAGREVVGLLRQWAGATFAIMGSALQWIAVETELATLATAK